MIKTETDFYKTLLDNLYDGVYFVDRDRKITYWNKGAERITGYTASEVFGRPCSDNILMHVDMEGNALCKGVCPMAATICDGNERSEKVFLRHKDGHRIPVNIRVAPVLNVQGKVVGGVEIFNNNASPGSQQDRLAELEKMAFLDGLTGLANRRYAEITLNARLEELERYGWQFGVLFIDIDHFKKINDEFGHDVGDDVLKVVGKTLQNSVRSFDMVSRWGGEEYLAIIAHVEEEKLTATANRCRVLVQRSKIPTEPSLHVTVSLGATIARPDDTLSSLFKRVDTLMYQSKEAGRNRVTVDE
jgi:diguanylate cyclase (GGDEF)-like protein/PAS domain S-box-containing protein